MLHSSWVNSLKEDVKGDGLSESKCEVGNFVIPSRPIIGLPHRLYTIVTFFGSRTSNFVIGSTQKHKLALTVYGVQLIRTRGGQFILHLQQNSLPDVLQKADDLFVPQFGQIDAVHRLDVVADV